MDIINLPKKAIMKASAHWLRIAKQDKKLAAKDKLFWSIAAEVQYGPRLWKPEIAQVFASDRASALASYFLSQPKPVKIVAVAPTLGYWVNDKDGKELST
jgi:hypothetical protein